ncbi:MAG: SurA N-terminal domain-containing protein [Bacteroidales bacterium]|jgi:peptidyl-prolyl cis-trans isomerase D|nr:SurA N-terminal domain-containing protein [Bacteroidales bacterium]
MSTLQFLREKAGVLVAVVIGIALLLFVVSDFFGSGSGQNRKARKYYEIGKIGQESVSYQDFEQKVQNLVEIYKLSGTSNLDEATTESIREQTWQQMIRERILDNQYKKLGIGVSAEEVDDLVLGNNPHQIVQQLFTDQRTGMFNKSFLVNFLKQTEVDETARKYWLFFEDEIVNDRMNAKYNALVSKGLFVTTRQIEFDKNLSASTVDFSYVVRNYSSVPDSLVKIGRNEIEDYYEKHKETFRRNAVRDVEYVTFDIVPSEDDIKQADEWINKTKVEFAEAADPVQFINLTADTRHIGFYIPASEVPSNLSDFVKKEDLKEVFGPYNEDGTFKLARLLNVANRPDSVHARHILLSPDQASTTEQLRRSADSLINLIRTGTRFEVLAIANSDDQGSAQLGGDLGWFPEGRMVLPFNNVCFSAKKGDIVTAETTFGIHIIEIIDQSRSTRKYNIGIVDRKIIPGSTTNQRIYSEASQFAGTNNTYEKFNQAVAEKGLNKRIANDITPKQKTLPGLNNARGLIISLFQTEETQIVLDNNQQAVFEIDDKYVVAYCTKAQDEGIAPLADVENEIRFNLLKDKKAEILSAEFVKNNEPGRSLDDIAGVMGLSVQDAAQVNFRSYTLPGAGNEPALIAAASAAESGSVTGPVKGDNGVYMLTVNNITKAEGEDSQSLKDRLLITYQMRGTYEAYEALRKEANIEDKRYKFY